jgi:predicted permease
MSEDRRRRPFWFLGRTPEAVESEVDEELRVHLEMRVAELKARGLSAEEARRAALVQFGDLEATRRYCRGQDLQKERHMRRGLWLQDAIQDMRLSLRSLLRAPVLAVTVVLTVGLGVGATTAMFALVHAILLRPLPYAEPDRLVRIYTDAPPNKFPFSVADYLALDEQQRSFERIAGYALRSMTFSDGHVAERLPGRTVSWTYFDLLGIRPVLGRSFTEADGRPGSPPAVIVSHGFWRERLGASADVIGKAIRLDGSAYELVGVLPPTLGPLERAQEFFVAAQWGTPPRRGPFFIATLGRLRPGTDPETAASELRAINKRTFPQWRSSYQDDKASWGLMSLQQHVVRDSGRIANVALAAVGLVWLIACTNASNLLISRMTSRRRELAVRAALGASRGRVIRYLLAESGVLALGAAAFGIGLAWAGIRLLRTYGASYLPRVQELALDGPVLWLLAALTVASALLFGLVPAMHGTGGPVDESLRSLGRTATGSVAVRRLRRVLVGAQFAVATPLLIAAGLLLATLNQLKRVDLGFDAHNLLSGEIQVPPAQYPQPAQVTAFFDELQRRVEALPGVSGVAFADGRPPNDVGNQNNFDLEAAPTPPGDIQPVTPWVAVTPEYFRLLGLTLLEGRLLDARDEQVGAPPAIVVDQAWARRFFPGGSAVGQRLHEGGCTTCPWVTVVGVVSGVKYSGLDAPDDGTVYQTVAARGPAATEQMTSRSRYLMLRTRADAAGYLPAVLQVLRDVDPSLPLSEVATIEDLVARELQVPRSLSLMVGGFAIVALLLSTVAIYGVMAYYVEQHGKDIAIRMALGGRRADVLRLVVGQGMRVVAVGIAVGLMGALGLTRLMSSLLFGTGAADAFTFGAAAALLLGVALLGCGVPAGRAVAVQPAAALRNE